MLSPAERIPDRLIGARITHAELRADRLLVLVFEHRGTDDDSGYLLVPPSFVSFNDGGDPEAWQLGVA